MSYFLLNISLNLNIDIFTPPEVSSQKQEHFIIVSEMMEYIVLVYICDQIKTCSLTYTSLYKTVSLNHGISLPEKLPRRGAVISPPSYISRESQLCSVAKLMTWIYKTRTQNFFRPRSHVHF